MTNREWNAIKSLYGVAPEVARLTMRTDDEVEGVIDSGTDFETALGLVNAAAKDAVRKFVEFGNNLEKDGFFTKS